jgi:hypothetical protein
LKIELSNAVVSGDNNVVVAQIKANTVNEELTRIETRNSTASHDNGNLLFYNRNGSTNTFAESMRIAGDGNVGIGTTDPYLKLHVSGDTRVQGNLMVGDASASNTPTAAIHIKSSALNAKLRIEDSDNANQYWDFLVDQGNALYWQRRNRCY